MSGLQTQAHLIAENSALKSKCAELEGKILALQDTINSLLPLKTFKESYLSISDAWQWEKSALTLQFDDLQNRMEILQDERNHLLHRVQELSNPAELEKRLAEIDLLRQKAQSELSNRISEPVPSKPAVAIPTNEPEELVVWKLFAIV